LRVATWELEQQIGEVKRTIEENDGRNVADSLFARRVDRLLSVFYDDIGELKSIPLRTLFELFLIKTLYVNRRSTDAGVLDYLAEMLARFLWSRELLPGATTAQLADLLAILVEESEDRTHFQNLFEAYRRLADNSLFITGMFPRSLSATGGRRHASRRRRAMAPPPRIDRARYVNLGKTYYRLAADHELAHWTGQDRVLAKLSGHFDVYCQALNELSERFVLGFDMNIVADKMLDNLNAYRRTGEESYLANARKYAALLSIDPSALGKLQRRRQAHA
jgi:hypothetical protein